MKIDTHTHVFLQDMPLVNNPRHAPSYSFTAEQLIETLDQHDVSKSVIAAASPWGDYNDYVIESLRKYPDRLRGTIIANPATINAYEMKQMQQDGIVGVRLPFINMNQLPDLTSWDYRKFLRRIADLGWHVHLHIEGSKLAQVLPLLEQSGVKIVIDHIGRLDAEDEEHSEGFRAMVRSIEKGRTWVKLSGAYRLGEYARIQTQKMIAAVGFDKMFWASDCPFVGHEASVTYQQTIDWLTTTITAPVAYRKIIGENAQAFYFH